MTKDGLCDTNNERGEDDADKFYREYDKVEKENPKIEDLKNTVVTDTEKEFEEQQKYFQARAESNSNSDNLPEVVEKIVSEQKEEEIAEADEQVEEESDDSDSEEVEEEQEEEYEPEEEEQEEEEPEEDNSDSESKE